MKIHVLSDLHIEFGPFTVPETGAELVVLAGDIGTGLAGIELGREQCAGRPVVYVAGNHEVYGHALPELTERMREAAAESSVHFLENDAIVLGGVRFLGCTLWTDFAVFGDENVEQAMDEARLCMNDYSRIRKSPELRPLAPLDTLIFHRRSRSWLRKALLEPFDGPTVVVTHHVPTFHSCNPRYTGDLLTTAFISDLEALMDPAHVQIWIHGHTHHCVDLEVRGVRVLSNQRGYPGEHVPGFRPDFTIEIQP